MRQIDGAPLWPDQVPHLLHRMAPARVFIVPYRDRAAQREVLLERLNCYLADDRDWDVYFVHQCDDRPFNRGAMKNIGFMAIKAWYPEHYQDITFIFHDVDTWPSWKGQFPYMTVPGVVAHYYGARFALGGVVAIKGSDFERSGGFANFWGWGLEDNVLQDRCLQAGLRIDRRVFYPLLDSTVHRAFDGFRRRASPREASVYKFGRPDGLRDLRAVRWRTGAGGMIHVGHFLTPTLHNAQEYSAIDIRSGTRLRANKNLLKHDPRLTRAPLVRRARSAPAHLTHRGRKKIKAPLGGIIRRWPPR